ncbi:MAG: helix-turn-helix transcriptional regulator [Pseudacidovorax sp.]|nr:helix-turn-helix transcriptional regulator [Pseudacidovorax sp.]
MSIPTIGKSVRGSRTGRPIMVALDLLGRRTALRVLWELRGDRQVTFRGLQEACETNSRLLSTRLAELKEAGLVEHEPGGYRLSEEGRRLSEALAPLSRWADGWAARKDLTPSS